MKVLYKIKANVARYNIHTNTIFDRKKSEKYAPRRIPTLTRDTLSIPKSHTEYSLAEFKARLINFLISRPPHKN
jgi:hypothetical protein